MPYSAPAGFTISRATTDSDRASVGAFLARHIEGVSATAVPPTSADDRYAPFVLQVRGSDGALVGGSLTMRAPMAIAYFVGVAGGLEPVDYASELDTVSNLDTMAVHPEHRGAGIGTALVAAMEADLAASGVRVWFGGISGGADSGDVARFYEHRGFRVLEPNNPLPTFLGRRWTLPHAPNPEFWFYKRPLAHQ